MTAPIKFPEVIDPLVNRMAAMLWLEDQGFTFTEAKDRWERVELVLATADEDHFRCCNAMFRVLNPQDFGVWGLAGHDALVEAQEAEPWTMAPPDVEPMPDMRIDLGEAPKPSRFPRAVAVLGWIAVIAAALSLFAMQVTRGNP